jgi:hypothetical protein
MGQDKKKKQEDGKHKPVEAPPNPAKRKVEDDELDDIFSKPKKQDKKPEGCPFPTCTCSMYFLDAHSGLENSASESYFFAMPSSCPDIRSC